jgi:UDP-4-amino-4,6-dideoxy-N-acetyl-beta-L-altrosamine transaminase
MTSPAADKKMLPYGRQQIDDDDIAAVVETLRSPFLTTGPKVREFEAAVAARVGATFGVSFSSGTAALHGAMAAAGLQGGDEVLVPTLSFLATANAAVYVGATPVFVDIEKNGFNLDLADARRKITPRTKAIAPVHFAGEPVELDAVHALAREHNLMVIEDAAHALGASYSGRPIGGLSTMTAFSFHPVKHITTAEGGMITTNDAELARRLRQFRHHGIDVDAVTREQQNLWYYDMGALGYNYRLTDVQSALGISQLKKLDRFVARRTYLAERYAEKLRGWDAVSIPSMGSASRVHAWHLFIVRIADRFKADARDQVFRALRAEGIGAQVHYRPIHLQSFYAKQNIRRECPVAEAAWIRFLTLPLFPAMEDADVDRVVDALMRHLR